MDPNVSDESKLKGLFNLIKKNIFFILPVAVVLIIFFAVVYLNSTGTFSPFKSLQQVEDEEDSETVKKSQALDSIPNQHIELKATFDKTTNKLQFESIEIKDSPYVSSEKTENLSYFPQDLSTDSFIRVGVMSLNSVQNDYYIKTDPKVRRISFTLNFPMRYIFNIYIADSKDKTLYKELMQI